MTRNISMPNSIKYHNASNEACDMIEGPCSCGAWHSINEWPHRLRTLSKKDFKEAMKDISNKLDTVDEKINFLLELV